MAELTTADLQRYVGGQAEIQNQGEGYIFRGDISEASVEGPDIKLEFDWLARGEGFPPLLKRWVKDSPRPYSANLGLYGISDIGDGRTCLNSSLVGETIVLFPKEGSRLELDKVEEA